MPLCKMKRIDLLAVVLLQSSALWSQQTPATAPVTLPEPAPTTAQTLLEAFQRGQHRGYFRSFLMATDNTRALSDYYAWAAGGGLYFNTATWHGFSAGIGGIFNFNLASSDLGAKDPATGASNRYEIGLFDVEDPANRNNLDRMEEFWLRYQHKQTRLTLGKQSVQTPFLNPQDGRMRPTAESGVWVESGAFKHTKIEGGWLWKISPRSTVRWYGIGESIGLYPRGLNPDGTGSGYSEQLKSAGIGLLGLSRTVGQHTKVQVWDQYVERIFNTTLVQVDYRRPFKNGHQLVLGGQFTHQNALADGGNEDPSKTYFSKGGQSNVLSTQVGWQRGRWLALAAYTHTTADGRFLSPREWGREPFYTFLTRERVEGSGNNHAVTGRIIWQNEAQKLRLEAAYGHFYLPDVKNAALNKYAFPSYRQFNFDARYTFGGVLKGLRAQVLYVWKGRIGEVYGNDKLVINRVGMSQYNVVLNYTY
jgi:hypothetical protein